jgi:CxxC motif-containing protein (DUF1111 family)
VRGRAAWLALLLAATAAAHADEFSDRVARGSLVFDLVWVVKPSPIGQWGRGPVSNADACTDCHARFGRGHAPDGDGPLPPSMVVRLTVAGRSADGTPRPDPVYGEQLQTQGVLGEVPAEGRARLHWQYRSVTLAGGERVQLREPRVILEDLSFGRVDRTLRASLRTAPPLRGLGLLEAAVIPSGPTGRRNVVWNMSSRQFADGRFGWKAAQPDLRQQIAHAHHEDMGVTSRLFPQENCGSTQLDCQRFRTTEQPLLSDEQLDDLGFLLRSLPSPSRQLPSPATQSIVVQGEKLFRQAGCATCHVPRIRTGVSAALPSLSKQTVPAYTDLRLHDMGAGLADGRPEFRASGRAWRTAPLWGLGADASSLLHDGRARSIAEAILWHGGEADRARRAYQQMTVTHRRALGAFLDSL